MARLRRSLEASESLELDSLDSSSDGLLLAFCEAAGVEGTIVRSGVDEVLIG
jgi:hypothetical protein